MRRARSPTFDEARRSRRRHRQTTGRSTRSTASRSPTARGRSRSAPTSSSTSCANSDGSRRAGIRPAPTPRDRPSLLGTAQTLGRRDRRRHRVAGAGRSRQLRRRRPRRRSSRGGASRRRPARQHRRRAAVVAGGPRRRADRHRQGRRARRRYSAPRASSSATGASSPPPSGASPAGVPAAAAADLTLTNAMRMFARASRNVGASGPSRSPSPSTRLPTASIASDGAGEVRWRRRQVDRGELVEAHHVVGDDDLGGHLGEPPAGVLDGLLGVTEHRLGVGRSGSSASRPRRPRFGRGILGHLSYPTGAISKRSGGDPHPATTTVRASGSYGTAGRCAQISSAGFASS